MAAHLGSMLDIITNQGIVMDELKKLAIKEAKDISEIKKIVSDTSEATGSIKSLLLSSYSLIKDFVPRAMKAMKFQSQSIKDILTRSEEAGRNHPKSVNEDD
jgi:hypothetical protein